MFIELDYQKLHQRKKNSEFLFETTILEDLYLMSKNKEDWSLCDCYCETENCLHGTIQMIEPVIGKSLNNLFSNMVAFYFPMQRSVACNVFNTFFFAKNDMHKLFQLKNGYLTSLNNSRKKVLLDIAKEKAFYGIL